MLKTTATVPLSNGLREQPAGAVGSSMVMFTKRVWFTPSAFTASLHAAALWMLVREVLAAQLPLGKPT